MSDFWGTGYLLLPLLGGGLLHGLCVKYDAFAFLARPMDGGRTVRGRPLFGRNKTFRGPAALAAGGALLFGLQTDVLHAFAALRGLELFDYATVNGWLLGAAMGAASMLSELPNSFLKRRLGIAPGRPAPGPLRAVFYALDQVDLLLGTWLVLAAAVPRVVTLPRIGYSILIVFVVHQLITAIGYALGMRATAR